MNTRVKIVLSITNNRRSIWCLIYRKDGSVRDFFLIGKPKAQKWVPSRNN